MHSFRDCLRSVQWHNCWFSFAARFRVEITRYEYWKRAVATRANVSEVCTEISSRYRFHVIGNTLLRLGLEMHSYSHVNADYRAAPFAVSTNGKVRGTHRRRGRVVGPAGIVALLRSTDRPINRSAVSSRRSISAIDLALLHVSSPFVTPRRTDNFLSARSLSRQISVHRTNSRYHR